MSPLYLARRLVHLLVTALVVSVLVFGITQILPANAATMLLGEFATPESLAALEAKLGLDRPAWVQYLDWMGGVLGGDLGTSLRTDLPVAPTVFEALGRSLVLAALALAGVVIIAIPLGVLAAVRRGGFTDLGVNLGSYAGISLPEFVLATMLLVWLTRPGIGLIFSRLLWGARTTVLLSLLATAIGALAGSALGILSGCYAGGWADELLMRFVDAMMAIPSLLFALLIVTVLGPSGVNAVIAIGIAFAPGIARVARSVTLSVRTSDYVAAAVARGESAGWIMAREVLPNVLAPVIVEATIRVAFAIMLLATLSFLGLGSRPPAPEWGLMISDARGFMFRSAWTIFWPGLAIAMVAVTFNLLGDALRDALNPRAARAG